MFLKLNQSFFIVNFVKYIMLGQTAMSGYKFFIFTRDLCSCHLLGPVSCWSNFSVILWVLHLNFLLGCLSPDGLKVIASHRVKRSSLLRYIQNSLQNLSYSNIVKFLFSTLIGLLGAVLMMEGLFCTKYALDKWIRVDGYGLDDRPAGRTRRGTGWSRRVAVASRTSRESHSPARERLSASTLSSLTVN